MTNIFNELCSRILKHSNLNKEEFWKISDTIMIIFLTQGFCVNQYQQKKYIRQKVIWYFCACHIFRTKKLFKLNYIKYVSIVLKQNIFLVKLVEN